MAKTKTTWKKGQSGNPAGKKAGTGRIEQYRTMLDPHVPELLKKLVEAALAGDLGASRIILERVYPVRDAALSDLMADIVELRELIDARKPASPDAEMAGLLKEVEELRRKVSQEGLQ